MPEQPFLVFRLAAPMASWGSIAVGDVRPSDAHPTRSALLGLVASAIGIDREDAERHEQLRTSFAFAVYVEQTGALLDDFHTVQAPQSSKKPYTTRAHELRAKKINTIISRRQYRCDASYLVAMWSINEASPWSFQDIDRSLRSPSYTLYLGRKSCPLMLPLDPQYACTGTIVEAMRFARTQWQEAAKRAKVSLPFDPSQDRKNQVASAIYWDGRGATLGHSGEVIEIRRRDEPTSRTQWQFAFRSENTTLIQL